jgi:uncharacterized protein YodC (DUF2158 family)
MEIQIGDTVTLKSGGPPMRVRDTGLVTGELFVQWDGDDDEVFRRTYHPDLLTVVSPASDDTYSSSSR